MIKWMSERNSSSRRQYLSTVGASIGLLTIPSVAVADEPGSEHNNKGKGKKDKLNYGFDPYDLDEVREFNSGMRNIIKENGKRQLKKIGARISDKQKEAIDDVNRPTKTVIKVKKSDNSVSTSSIEESGNGEKKVVDKRVKKHKNHNSIREKWGWDIDD